jgi:ketosteroid isomerase-like protein
MKTVLVVTLLALALSTVAFGQKRAAGARPQGAPAKTAAPAGRVQEQIKKLEEEWAAAYIKGDAAALGRILADDYTLTDENGSLSNKAQAIQALASGDTTFESIKFDDLKVRVYGAFAIVTGGEIITVRADGMSETSTFRFTDVFALRGGRWQAISSQFTNSIEVGITVVKKPDGSRECSTPTGLKYIDLVEGKGVSPKPGQTLLVHYTGTLENGFKFDSSVDKGQPLAFPIGLRRVIKGWDEGIMSMKVGGKRKLIVPPHLGYGARGAGGVIPPNATLIFEVELVGIR